MTRIDHYHRVKFESERAMDEWAAALMRLAVRPLGLTSAGAGDRPVVFVPLIPPTGKLVFGYVSDDARVLADGFAPGVQLDGAVVRLNELPNGLTLLYGDGGDAEAYEHRARAR